MLKCKKDVIVYFKILSQHSFGATLIQSGGSLGTESKLGLFEYEEVISNDMGAADKVWEKLNI
jgi:hypothetical protein